MLSLPWPRPNINMGGDLVYSIIKIKLVSIYPFRKVEYFFMPMHTSRLRRTYLYVSTVFDLFNCLYLKFVSVSLFI